MTDEKLQLVSKDVSIEVFGKAVSASKPILIDDLRTTGGTLYAYESHHIEINPISI